MQNDERRNRVLRAGALQILWALLLVYLILVGTAILFGRQVGYGTAFAVCGGVAALVTLSFLSVYLVDRVTARIARRKKGNTP